MKVFLSWSGSQSHRVACALRDWLPSVIQALRPYVSSEDIDKGARWSTDIAQELEAASYGIICVTSENLEAPWVHFEAGALSKSLEKANVVPFLFGLKHSEVQGPLLQFQSVIFEKSDVDKLVRGLNKRLEPADQLSEEAIEKAFRVWWPQLKETLDTLQATDPVPSDKSKGKPASQLQILEEILELVRSQQRILSSPEMLTRPSYLHSALSDFEMPSSRRIEEVKEQLDWLHGEVMELEPLLFTLAQDHPEVTGLAERLERLHSEIHGTRHRGVTQRRIPVPPERLKRFKS